jgi:hypothetical protein
LQEDSAHNLGVSPAVPFTVDAPAVTTTPSSAAQTTGTMPSSAGGTTSQGRQRLPVTFSRQRLRTVLRRGFIIRSGTQAQFKLVLARKLAKRYRLGRKSVVVARRAGTGRIVLRFSARARRALRHARAVRLSLVATDGVQTLTRAVKLIR